MVVSDALADAALAAIDAEPPFNTGVHVGESQTDYRRRLKRAEWSAIWAYIAANAVVSTSVAAGIACSVDPVSHAGTTTAPGSGTGTIA